jgi:hypothetical protein
MQAFWAVENFAGFGIRFATFSAQGPSGFSMKINQTIDLRHQTRRENGERLHENKV